MNEAAVRSPQPTLAADLRLVIHQARYELAGFWRNPQSRYFTIILPILFLVIFSAVFGNHTTRSPSGATISTATYYVPGILTLGIVAACLVNQVIAITTERELGVLKRRRATPVPAWVLIAGRALSATVVALALVAILLLTAAVLFSVRPPVSTIPAIALASILGALTFCCISYAIVSFIGSAAAAQPVVQATVLPLYFISGIFVPDSNLPHWLKNLASVFPVRHLSQALLTAFDPRATGAGIAAGHLVVLAAWGIGAVAIALRRFTWAPRAD